MLYSPGMAWIKGALKNTFAETAVKGALSIGLGAAALLSGSDHATPVLQSLGQVTHIPVLVSSTALILGAAAGAVSMDRGAHRALRKFLPKDMSKAFKEVADRSYSSVAALGIAGSAIAINTGGPMNFIALAAGVTAIGHAGKAVGAYLEDRGKRKRAEKFDAAVKENRSRTAKPKPGSGNPGLGS